MDNQRAIITMTKELKTFILNTGDDNKVILLRIIVGLIFLSEGIQKFLFPDLLGTVRFEKIGFTDPSFGHILLPHLKLFVAH